MSVVNDPPSTDEESTDNNSEETHIVREVFADVEEEHNLAFAIMYLLALMLGAIALIALV